MSSKTISALACCLLLAVSCSQDDGNGAGSPSPSDTASATTEPTAGSPPSPTPSPTPTPAHSAPTEPDAGPDQATLDTVAVDRELLTTLISPTDAIGLPDSDEVYISTLDGGVWIVPSAGDGAQKVLDLSSATSTSGEGGLLALAFSDDGSQLFVSHTRSDGDLTLASYAMSGLVPDETSRREIVVIDKPTNIHNAGDLNVTSDGLVWWSTGDGGPADEPPSTAQDPDSLLGKILRVDPTETDPTVEVWALGLRNPWRFSIDPATNDVWIGDVGRYDVEEIDRLAADASGANLQWPLIEGDQPLLGSAPSGSSAPLMTYTHDGTCAVTGGVVYRGSSIPDLRGAYLYGDLCEGRLRALVADGADVAAERTFDLDVPRFVSLGYDGRGEVLLVSLDGEVSRLIPAAG